MHIACSEWVHLNSNNYFVLMCNKIVKFQQKPKIFSAFQVGLQDAVRNPCVPLQCSPYYSRLWAFKSISSKNREWCDGCCIPQEGNCNLDSYDLLFLFDRAGQPWIKHFQRKVKGNNKPVQVLRLACGSDFGHTKKFGNLYGRDFSNRCTTCGCL